MVCDTPATLSNQGCSTSGGCEDAMVENFMDYTSEACRETFSVGQAERMWEHLLDEKQQLIDSYACIAPVDYDVSITSTFYSEQWCTDYQDIWVTITNQGNESTPFAEVVLTCGGVEYTEELYDLTTGSGVAVLFSDVLVSGADGFEVEVNSALDEYSDNNTGYWPLDYQDGDLLTIDIHKDFWGCIGWQFMDGDGEILVEDYYTQERPRIPTRCASTRGATPLPLKTVRVMGSVRLTLMMTASVILGQRVSSGGLVKTQCLPRAGGCSSLSGNKSGVCTPNPYAPWTTTATV